MQNTTTNSKTSSGPVSTRKFDRQIKFLTVGGICYLITIGINFILKWTILENKPTSSLIIATTIASVVSYSLNKRWTFDSRGSHHSAIELVLFALVTGFGIIINSIPLYISRYVLGFENPPYSFLFQEVADFISGPILGTALAMVFRWAAMDLVVFADNRSKWLPANKKSDDQQRPM